MPSPAQPTATLTSAEIDRCVKLVRASAWQPNSGPVVLAYATGIQQDWQLGTSAASHGAPLVLAGLGRRGWQWWNGGGGKLPGTARALQILQALAPNAPIVFADSGDTMVANHYSQEQARSRLLDSSSVLTGAECNSWPLCYNQSYMRDQRFRRCLKAHATCYPNSGTYLGHAAPLLAFVRGLQRTMAQLDARGYNGSLAAEKGDDQAALHHLYLESRGLRSTAGTGRSGGVAADLAPMPLARLRIDSANAFFLSLFACSSNRFYRMRGSGPFEYCHEKPFDAMPRVQSVGNGSGLHVRPEAAETSATSAGEHANALRPFVLHANGKHYRLRERALAPVLRRLRATPASALDGVSVLLIDSVAKGTCGVASLGSILRGWKTRTTVEALSETR